MKVKKIEILITLIAVSSIFYFSSLIYAEAISIRDSDYDGIADEVDLCPLVPETYNKFEDSDGCPDSVVQKKTDFKFPDTDGDGIEDRVDKCVLHPENFNNYLDQDGCPEIIPDHHDIINDFDSDSIPDSIDACPGEKETFNDFKDADGCPDSLIVSSTKISLDKTSSENQCLMGKIPVIRINSKESICILTDTAKRWEELGIGKIQVLIPEGKASDLKEPSQQKIPDPKVDVTLPKSDDPMKFPSTREPIQEVSSVTILETGETIIGQDISYPLGDPLITSKIITIPVGSETGPHTHEYPLFAYVLKGEITVNYENEGTKTFVKGDSIMEAIQFTHNGKNTGNVPTEILIVIIGLE